MQRSNFIEQTYEDAVY